MRTRPKKLQNCKSHFKFLKQKSKSENLLRARFKAKESFHYTPDSSRKPFQSKSTLHAQGIGILKSLFLKLFS